MTGALGAVLATVLSEALPSGASRWQGHGAAGCGEGLTGRSTDTVRHQGGGRKGQALHLVRLSSREHVLSSLCPQQAGSLRCLRSPSCRAGGPRCASVCLSFVAGGCSPTWILESQTSREGEKRAPPALRSSPFVQADSELGGASEQRSAWAGSPRVGAS